jgi:hypothetical protein
MNRGLTSVGSGRGSEHRKAGRGFRRDRVDDRTGLVLLGGADASRWTCAMGVKSAAAAGAPPPEGRRSGRGLHGDRLLHRGGRGVGGVRRHCVDAEGGVERAQPEDANSTHFGDHQSLGGPSQPSARPESSALRERHGADRRGGERRDAGAGGGGGRSRGRREVRPWAGRQPVAEAAGRLNWVSVWRPLRRHCQ